MQLEQPNNALVLASLKRHGSDKAAVARHDAVPDAYLHCGCHPDIVERLWDQIGASLPEDCRYLLYGTPALAHPSGLILALGIGTQYGLRIPVDCMPAAIASGAKSATTWSGGSKMDIQSDYGKDWLFGSWVVQEFTWCKLVYQSCQNAAA